MMKLKFNFILVLGLLARPCAALEDLAAPAQAPAALADPARIGVAQRLIALLDYVARDYGGAVQGGKVVAPAEYEEQLHFARDAAQLATELAAPGSALEDPVVAGIAALQALLARKAEPGSVAKACRATREVVVSRFRVPTSPPGPPSLARAESLFASACAACHGARGEGDSLRALSLDPPPADFRRAAGLGHLSPYQAFNAVTVGVPGTSMPAFDVLSPAERWDLAFYVLRLGHQGEPHRPTAGFGLPELAILADRELLERLAAGGREAPQAALAWLRTEAPFEADADGPGIEGARRAVREAVALSRAGRAREADRLVLDAYLNAFEPAEASLRVRDPGAAGAAEEAFLSLRAALAAAEPLGVSSAAQRLDERLESISRPPARRTLPFLAALLIYLREGVEAALLVGALLAGAARLARSDCARYVHAGWMLALPAGALTWWATARLLELTSARRELVEAVVSLAAAAVLFSASFWLISNARSRRWRELLQRRLARSLGPGGRFALAGLAFIAVYREAAETILFTQALRLESRGAEAQVWAGAAAGLGLVALLALAMRGTALRLPLAPFFGVSGLLLCALAAAFAGSGVHELVAAGHLKPRPVPFPEVGWLGVHPDLTGLLVQLTILVALATAAVAAPRRGTPLPSPTTSRR